MPSTKLLPSGQGLTPSALPNAFSLEKDSLIVEYLQKMSLPSMFNRELAEEDYETWVNLLRGYSAAAISYAFEKWIENGSKFPLPMAIEELCGSYAEQEGIKDHWKEKNQIHGMPPNVVIAILPELLERAQSFHARGINPSPPVTEKEIVDMLSIAKHRGGEVVAVDRFPNGNKKYNKALVQARVLHGMKCSKRVPRRSVCR